MSKAKLSKIEKRVAEFSKHDQYKDRQERLKVLVEQHGLECVAKATGYTVGTLAHYLRLSVAPTINENPVSQAEAILRGL